MAARVQTLEWLNSRIDELEERSRTMEDLLRGCVTGGDVIQKMDRRDKAIAFLARIKYPLVAGSCAHGIPLSISCVWCKP